MAIRFDKDKFRELILFFAERSADDPLFGATKLNKQLFFSDFLAYAEYGAPVTGATYQRLPNGPAPRQLLPVQDELARYGEITIQERSHFGLKQKRIQPLRSAAMDLFSAEEVRHVNEVFKLVGPMNARGVSDYSHEWLAWEIAPPGEPIPYEAAFLSARPPSSLEIQRGQALAAAYGWR